MRRLGLALALLLSLCASSEGRPLNGGGCASPCPVTPNEVPGLAVWYKSSSGCLNGSSLACANGDTVATWQDKSGNSVNATTGTGCSGPVYFAKGFIVGGVTAAPPSIQFTNSSSQCLLAQFDSEPAAIFVVYIGLDQATTGRCLLGQDTTAGETGPDGAWYLSNVDALDTQRLAFNRNEGNTNPATYWNARANPDASFWQSVGFTNNGTTMTVYKGAVTGQATTNPGGTYRPIDVTKKMTIGACYYNHAIVNYLSGAIAEIAIFTSVPSAAQIAGLMVYFNQTYGISPGGRSYVAVSMQSPDSGNAVATSLTLLSSTDAQTWDRIDANYLPPDTHYTRDPVIFYWPAAGEWVGLFGFGSGSFGIGTHAFDVATAPGSASAVGTNFTYQCSIDTSSITGTSTPGTWEPRPIKNTDGSTYQDGSGLFHAIVVLSSNSGTTHQHYEMHPTTTNPCGSWSSPTLITASFSLSNKMWDSWVIYDGTNFNYWFVNAVNSPETIDLMQSASMTSGYSSICSACLGNGNQDENIALMKLSGGTWRAMFFDTSTNTTYRTDNTSSTAYAGAGTWGTNTALTINNNANFTSGAGLVESLEPHLLP